MKIIPRDKLPNFTLPLPIFTSVHIADAICKRGEEFDVLVGLETKYVDQLKKLSLDESDTDLQENTGDAARFGTGSYEVWYKKNRTIFALVHKQTDMLAAIAWYGPKSLGKKSIKLVKETKDKEQKIWHTGSFRSYPLFRGRGVMKIFIEFSMNFYRRHFLNIKFWLGMDDRNGAMTKLASALGFEVDEKNSDLSENWLVMTKV
jgi:hypothetical protein